MARPRLRDVAELAGTSTAVVSYVINEGPRPVAPETRRRVEAAIAQLGYRPNKVARSLRTRRSGTFGLVVPDLTKSFFAELAAAVESAAMAADRRLLITSAQFSPTRELEQVQALLDAQVDAIALAPTGDLAPTVALLRRSGLPWTLLHRHPQWTPDESGHAVVGADHEAGRIATEHLLQHGHTRIACLAGPRAGTPVQRRVDGYRQAMLTALGSIPEELILACGYEQLTQAAHQATVSLLRQHPDVTALCATTDEHAMGVYRAAAEEGRQIGRDFAVVSIDGTSHTAFLTPSLTVLAAPIEEMGTQTVDILLQEQADADRATAPLSLTLITRQSCGC